MHLWIGTSSLGITSSDPKANCTIKSVNGLYCFEAMATTSKENYYQFGHAMVLLGKTLVLYIYMLYPDCLEGVLASQHSWP